MALDSAKARKKIEAIEGLPTLPTVVTQIVEMANSPTTNAADVGKLIEQDQALTTKVLKLVNSSFYGFPGQIKSIQHAVVIIGFNKVKNVVVTAAVFDMTKGHESKGLNINRLWEHSLGAAIGSKIAAAAIGGDIKPEDAFVGGLLHDIGKLILDLFLPDEYAPVIEKIEAEKCLILHAEKEVLGFTHALVGSWIAERWRLPRPLQHAIRFHHTPAKAREEGEMAAAVHLGDILARAIGIGNSGDGSMYSIDPTIWEKYQFGSDFLDKALGSMIAEIKLAGDFFDLIEGD